MDVALNYIRDIGRIWRRVRDIGAKCILQHILLAFVRGYARSILSKGISRSDRVGVFFQCAFFFFFFFFFFFVYFFFGFFFFF